MIQGIYEKWKQVKERGKYEAAVIEVTYMFNELMFWCLWSKKALICAVPAATSLFMNQWLPEVAHRRARSSIQDVLDQELVKVVVSSRSKAHPTSTNRSVMQL